MLNIIAVVERDDWRQESWYDRGTHAEWLNDFADWHDDARATIAAAEQPFKGYPSEAQSIDVPPGLGNGRWALPE